MARSYTERFGGEEADCPPRPLGLPPDHTYLIASTPRSGSNFLGDALRTSGGLGVPMEYLDTKAAMPFLASRWEAPDLATYLASLHARRTSETGWFGLKAHWHQLLEFRSQLLPGDYTRARARELRMVVEQLFPDTRWIHLRREDVVGQAVSFWRASRTGQFVRVDDGQAAEPDVDAAALRSMAGVVQRIRAWDASWLAFFDATDVTPYELTYTDLAADVAGTVGDIRRWLGVGPGQAPEVSTKRQRDAWTQMVKAQLQDAIS